MFFLRKKKKREKKFQQWVGDKRHRNRICPKRLIHPLQPTVPIRYTNNKQNKTSLSLFKTPKPHNSQSPNFPTISFLSPQNSHMGILKYSPNQMDLLLNSFTWSGWVCDRYTLVLLLIAFRYVCQNCFFVFLFACFCFFSFSIQQNFPGMLLYSTLVYSLHFS